MTTASEPTSVPVFKRVLKWSAAVALAVAVVGGAIGLIVAGVPGLVSALIAAALTLVFAGITVLSVILAAHLDTMFFLGIILGAWLLKFILFLGTLFAIRDQPFIHDWVLWGSLVAAVIGTLAVDVICVVTGRIGHVSDVQLQQAPAAADVNTDDARAASSTTDADVADPSPAIQAESPDHNGPSAQQQ